MARIPINSFSRQNGSCAARAGQTLPLRRLEEASIEGLTEAEAARRRSEAEGLSRRQKVALGVSTFLSLTRRLVSPLTLILVVSSIVSALLGERTGAAIILVIVGVSAAWDFAQTVHSQRAVERLRQQVAPTATVKRNGVWREISPDALVCGDRIRVQAGDLIPADARIVHTTGLFVQQSALTGESLPVEKRQADEPSDTVTANPNDPARIFQGTSVTSGSGEAIVTATGTRTAFGQIAQQLRLHPPETEFERGMRELSLLITRAVFALVLFVLSARLLLHRPAIDSLLFAIALAVGLTPEFLPMIATVTLGRGAIRMARQKVIVKRLQSIENLGGMDILCSDKTGTLTSETMRLAAFVDPLGATSARVLAFARLNSWLGASASGLRADALDGALQSAPQADTEPATDDAALLRAFPFDFGRRRASVVVTWQDKTLLIAKGAPETVLALCSAAETPSGVTTLDDSRRANCGAVYRQFSEQGYRVLAVAIRELSPTMTPLSVGDEREMTLVGYVAFENPPLPDAARVLEKLREAGVAIKLLTGDNDLVTRRLCQAVGLPCERITLGDEVDRLDDAALTQRAETTSVFARMSPRQKTRVALALKSRGHVVGFLGDGINDAPSLHVADVGISVAGAADVARDAADIILLERSLGVLYDGIREGRRAFANVLKYLLMDLSSNFGNMLSMAAASPLLPFLPMLPMQILLNNFLYDLSQAALPTDNVDEAILRFPHRWEMQPIRDFMILIGPLSSLYDLLTFYILRTAFHASEAFFHTGWFIESLVTQTLIVFVIRTAAGTGTASAGSGRSRPSAFLTGSIVTVIGVAVLLPYSPLAPALGFVPMPLTFFAFVGIVTGTYLALVSLAKRRVMQHLYANPTSPKSRSK